MRITIVLIITTLILSIISVFIGAYNVNWGAIFHGDLSDLFILIDSRLPRLLAVLTTGMSLAVAGLIMQSLTGNKFVSPTTAGVSSFSSLGVVIALIFTKNYFARLTLSFLVTVIGSVLFIILMQKIKYKDRVMIPLIGMMLGGAVAALTSYLTLKFDMSQAVSGWLQGSFTKILRGNYEILYLTIPATVLAFIYANKFTIVGMGDEFSINLGVNPKFITFIGLLLVSLITASVVVTVGEIAFVGLIIPNVISLIKGDNIRRSIFDTLLLGGAFLLGSDILARLIIYPYEISVGVIVSIIGCLLFFGILYVNRRRI